MKKYAVIVAGGSGKRMGAQSPKQFLLLDGKPVIWHTLTVFLQAFDDLEIILVLPEEHMETGRTIAQSTGAGAGRIRRVAGGETRWHSVKLGLGSIPAGEESIVFVHDGVRCLVSGELIRHCYEEALRHGSAIPVIECRDSVRMTEYGSAKGKTEAIGERSSVVDRSRVKLVQTPQTFTSRAILDAFAGEYREEFTDEAMVYEAHGGRVHLVEGEAANIKITTPIDMIVAEGVLSTREAGGGNPL